MSLTPDQTTSNLGQLSKMLDDRIRLSDPLVTGPLPRTSDPHGVHPNLPRTVDVTPGVIAHKDTSSRIDTDPGGDLEKGLRLGLPGAVVSGIDDGVHQLSKIERGGLPSLDGGKPVGEHSQPPIRPQLGQRAPRAPAERQSGTVATHKTHEAWYQPGR